MTISSAFSPAHQATASTWAGAPDGIIHAVATQPLILLFAIIGIGAAVGTIKFKGISLGPAAALFVGLAASAWDVRLELPPIVGTLGLALFCYTIGVSSGSAFFHGLRRGARVICVVVLGVGLCLALTVLGGALLGLSHASSLGAFSGALTNTPALAAVTAHSKGSAAVVGYSITYLGGVILMLAAAAWASRRAHPAKAENAIITRTAHVTTLTHPTPAELVVAAPGPLRLTRVAPAGGEASNVVNDAEIFAPGDLVTMVGEEQAVQRTVDALGYTSHIRLSLNREELDFRRMTISDKALGGSTIGALRLTERFEAQASRLRRGDVDLVATDQTVVYPGDRIRIIAPRARLAEIARFFGDSERGASDINPIGLAIGMTLGLILGYFTIPLPGGASLSLGAALGTLVVGLIAGRVGRTGPITWMLPGGVSHAFGQFGILAFLGYAGSHSGHALVNALSSPEGIKLFGLGLVTTCAFIAMMLFAAGKAGVTGARLAGLLGGAQTQPAVLAFAQDSNGGDPDVNVGYALVYPAAMLTKILLVTILSTLLIK